MTGTFKILRYALPAEQSRGNEMQKGLFLDERRDGIDGHVQVDLSGMRDSSHSGLCPSVM